MVFLDRVGGSDTFATINSSSGREEKAQQQRDVSGAHASRQEPISQSSAALHTHQLAPIRLCGSPSEL